VVLQNGKKNHSQGKLQTEKNDARRMRAPPGKKHKESASGICGHRTVWGGSDIVKNEEKGERNRPGKDEVNIGEWGNGQ